MGVGVYPLKKIIKCFVPYGLLVLRERLPLTRFRKILTGKKAVDKNTVVQILNESYKYPKILTGKKAVDKNTVVQILNENYKYPIYVRINTSDMPVYMSCIINQEYDCITKEEPKYIIDAGANIGLASIYFAEKYKRAKIIAIEPEDGNYELLKRNTEKYDNIFAIKAALWNTSGEISLFDTGLDNWGFMVETNASALKPAASAKHLTKAITVSEIMRQFNIESIDILKMDIEGAEKEVFESCDDWVDKTKCVIVELHERMKKGCYKAFLKIKNSFDQIGQSGEDIYLSKNDYIKMQ
ncbi:MAG: FkbM family methyltransferase [Spirochaetaceae bacterium]|jgi:FkbM family methyltransferase|nr:FkbM family methyltransferase [Spirochaetaceae bacterium]